MMDKRGLTDLGYLLFLDRYALKDGTRDSLTAGDVVLIKVGNQKIICTLQALNEGEATVVDAEGNSHVVNEGSLDKPLELDPKRMWQRAANAVAQAELTSAGYEEWLDKFEWLLDDWKFLPGGRILAGAGTDTELTLYNCYVIPSPKDSKDEIFKSVNTMAQLMARGGGVGVNISTLRPKYAYAKSTNGRSSGAVSWGELYSYTTGLIEQGGSRRGALLLMLADWHPDVLDYVNVKRDNTRIVNANISIAISDDFMKAVSEDADWQLIFPDTSHPSYDVKWDGNIKAWQAEGFPVKVWKTLKARDLWNAIIESAWACAEPGLWFVDHVNKYSNSQYYAPLISTNPCGEISLPAWGCCNLGSINLSKFVYQRRDIWDVDWELLGQAVRYAIRFLDNVIDITPYTFPEIEKQQKSERRVGLGTMGLAEMLIRLNLRYGSDESVNFTDELYSFIAKTAYETSVELAAEKGAFSNYSEDILNSQFMKSLTLPDAVMNVLRAVGLRNVTLLTQAPTGTIGTMVNTSTGIEPFYFWEYERKGQFGSHIERVKVYEEFITLMREREYVDGSLVNLPNWFVTAQDLSPEEHVRMQAAIQRWVDASISKTCNVPNDYTVEQVGELYWLMYELGCKGGTVYRDGSRSEQILNLKTDKSSTSADIALPQGLGTPSGQLEGWRKRPESLNGTTYHKHTPVGTAYMTVNHNGTGEPFETFINIGRAGSDIAADAEGLGRLISLILRMPSPLNIQQRVENIAAQLRGIGSGRAHGFGKNRVTSLPDAVAQVLMEHAKVAQLPGLPEYETNLYGNNGDACPECGNYTVQLVEGCKKCYNCGHSEC